MIRGQKFRTWQIQLGGKSGCGGDGVVRRPFFHLFLAFSRNYPRPF
nr:MAG TPA: hypothetical protein [Caudoviricetes sp.]